MKTHGKRWMLLLVVALLLAACGGQEAQPTEAPTEAPEPTETAPEPTEEMDVTNAVTVSDQTLGADGTVTVDNVTADVDGWMVIHADDGGAPGPVIGHAPVSAGENSDVIVEVDTSQVTDTLYAMLHVDAGVAGEYEFPGDDGPAMDTEGNVVTPPFTVSLPNSVTVEDQTIEDGTVTIASVSAAVPGWMVIHADDGGPGPVIGFAPVEQGQNSDVVVDIDASQATETLYAMLHVDAGTEGEYEFPGDDGPAMDADGNVVTPPFMVTLPNSVTVDDQTISEEGTVTIAGVSAAVPGWMVIHAHDGGPGPVIGFAPVEQGQNSDVVVEIDTSQATETLYAMLHVDAGVEGEYEFPGDDGPAMDAEGNVVTPPFMVTFPNSVTVDDQAISDEGTVTIASISAAVPGWLVVHADDEGGPGPVIGYAPVEQGLNSDVAVEIDTAAATETLYAMLHVDAGVEGEYEFPGDDGPAMDAEGNVVTPPFMVTSE